ncbi:MAG: M23 family metallopeptidase [Pyrinomonadaceae bacterium]|nr:M23 family metallopeptidase [Pyrinomonadaceae bacterium]
MRIWISLARTLLLTSCGSAPQFTKYIPETLASNKENSNSATQPPSPEQPSPKHIPEHLLVFPASSFASPVGEKEYVTEKRDRSDEWYNALDFGESRHLGEDWNKNSGGDTDCGEPVYAAAAGEIVLAEDAGPGWGNVVIIEHTAPNGTKLRTLYGHLTTIDRNEGTVARREKIGTIGNANGRYKCHLHFELRSADSPLWSEPGPGYSDSREGSLDPSEFIRKTRR